MIQALLARLADTNLAVRGRTILILAQISDPLDPTVTQALQEQMTSEAGVIRQLAQQALSQGSNG